MAMAALLCGAALLGTSCNEDEGRGQSLSGSAERKMLLSSLAKRVVLPTLRDFAAAAKTLRDETAAYAKASAADVMTDGHDPLAAFLPAVLLWQRAELMRMGPAGAPGMVMGGLGLRDEIYSYPTVASCRVDQTLVEDGYAADDFFDAAVVNAYGLDALSYLIANDASTNTCTSIAAINSDGSWDVLSTEMLRQRRADYAARVAAEIARRATELRDAWEPSEGNFAAEFGGKGKLYDSPHEALDAVFAAMFYLDLVVKDRKLAVPAGISPDCAQTRCPEAVEDPWAKSSGLYVAANLRALRDIWHGGPLVDGAKDPEAYGFDDLLHALDASALADTLSEAIDRAVVATEALPADLAVAVVDDHDVVVEAHARVKDVTDLLKSQLVTVLGLRVPLEGAGDND